MKTVTKQMEFYYHYDGVNYIASEEKRIRIGDLVFDCRDKEFKVIEASADVIDFACVAPELYFILKQVD